MICVRYSVAPQIGRLRLGHDPSGEQYFPEPILRFTEEKRRCHYALVQLLQVCGRVLFSEADVPKVLSMRLRALRGRFCFNGVKVCRLKEVVCGREQLIAFQELAGKVD